MARPHYCRKSPTKAHHWIFPRQGSDDQFNARCKYCKEERTFAHRSIYDLNGKSTGDSWRRSNVVDKGEKV